MVRLPINDIVKIQKIVEKCLLEHNFFLATISFDG